MPRPDKDMYFMQIAKEVSKRATCLRRRFGAVIVKDGWLLHTGYNGAPKGFPNCCDRGVCIKDEMNLPPGGSYENCPAVHAEMNAIIHAGQQNCVGATLYLWGEDVRTGKVQTVPPCPLCARMIVNAGIEKTVIMAEGGNLCFLLTDGLMRIVGKHYGIPWAEALKKIQEIS